MNTNRNRYAWLMLSLSAIASASCGDSVTNPTSNGGSGGEERVEPHFGGTPGNGGTGGLGGTSSHGGNNLEGGASIGHGGDMNSGGSLHGGSGVGGTLNGGGNTSLGGASFGGSNAGGTFSVGGETGEGGSAIADCYTTCGDVLNERFNGNDFTVCSPDNDGEPNSAQYLDDVNTCICAECDQLCPTVCGLGGVVDTDACGTCAVDALLDPARCADELDTCTNDV